MIAILYAVVLAALHPLVVESATRRRELGVLHSDEYTESVLTLKSSNADVPVGFTAKEHAKIASMLDTTKEIMDTANALIFGVDTLGCMNLWNKSASRNDDMNSLGIS